MDKKSVFAFGKNWQNFLKNFNEERLNIAQSSITEFLDAESIKDRTFLDIGCGSGLFSYAAYKLGAKQIASFDVDPFSVACCKYLQKKANKPKNWQSFQGSVLDKEFLSKLGQFDIVFSWGVLHHTGNMWEAIKNAAELVNSKGFFFIALYNKIGGILGSKFWWIVKKLYNRSPVVGKYYIEFVYMVYYIAMLIKGKQNPLKYIKTYKTKRGMSWRTDVRDWVGGFPYEFATVDEIIRFMLKIFPNFHVEKTRPVNNLANNWFLFQRL